jgi:hypothetical protein
MHKLVTIYLDEGSVKNSAKYRHGKTEEWLTEYLEDGWKVMSVTPIGAASGEAEGICGWLTVVLEKD